MNMLGEVRDLLERYIECASEIQQGSEITAAEKVKGDAQTFFETNHSKLN